MKYISTTFQVEIDNCDPNGVVEGPAGSYFYRRGNSEFYIITDNKYQRIDVSKRSFLSQYQGDIWYATITDDFIIFSEHDELWYKAGQGGNSIDWVFVGYKSPLM